MRTLDDLIREARQLTLKDRARLIETLEESLDGDKAEASASLDHPYANTLRVAGTLHSEFEDVSSDKYKHLSQALLDRSQDE